MNIGIEHRHFIPFDFILGLSFLFILFFLTRWFPNLGIALLSISVGSPLVVQSLQLISSALLSGVGAEFEDGETVYAHCEAKICPKNQENTCSTERISDGQENGSKTSS